MGSDPIREEIKRMRDLTEKPFGVNIAQAFVRDPDIATETSPPTTFSTYLAT